MTRDQIIERVAALMHLGDRSDLSPTDEALLGDIATAIVDMIAGEIEALQAECLEQARLNGKGAEREAALMARVEALQAENAKMREAIAYHYARNGTAYDIACDTLYADRAALTTQENPE